MELASKYNPADVEGKWYQYWLGHKLFSSKSDGRKPYTIIIPPPSVAGVLHMGHMLNNTIQDVFVRRTRMEGKNACWVPDMDHASIATEAKAVNKLAAQGIKKTDLIRDEFLKHAWEWTDEHDDIILKQLHKLGASCGWNRTAFTMDEKRSENVLKVFVNLYNKDLIYRSVRMVNWDPKALTALSDGEVTYKEEHSRLHYLKYYVADDDRSGETGTEGEVVYRGASGGRYAVVATTCPETIMGNTAMCTNPAGPKNQWLRDKKVIVPLVSRVIPVIQDDYVDVEFGTGCLRVTSTRDVNDYMLDEEYNLPATDILNDNGTLSEVTGLYVGMNRFDVREQIERDLQHAGLLERVEAYTNKVGFSRHTNVAIEPKLSVQWFLKMQHFADMTLPPVMNDDLKFYPARYKSIYKNWPESIKDWCISRQLWWGYRIPVYFLPEGGYVVAATPEEALKLAQEKTGDPALKAEDLCQDEDCLDIRFSSWLWPISLLDGILNPGNEEISYHYPTSDLATGPDIIFFWVAHMIMTGYKYEGKIPLKNVYFTGIVRDRLGRKMSKSLGNSPDPLDLIDRYDVDGVRMGMMLSALVGNDILFDDTLCERGRNFNNKVRNAPRLVKGWEVSAEVPMPEAAGLAIRWFGSKQSTVAAEAADLFGEYRLSEALMAVYKLFWDEFSSWYLEMIKPAYGRPINKKMYEATVGFFDNLLHLLYPFMPFITEELWQHIIDRKDGESLMVSPISMSTEADETSVQQFEMVKKVISNVRSTRLQKNITQKETLELQVVGKNPVAALGAVIMKMCNLSVISVVEAKADGTAAFMVGTAEYAVSLGNMIDMETEIARMRAELKHKEGFLQGVLKKLSSEKFANNASATAIEAEHKKQTDVESIINSLKESIAALKKA